MSRHTRTLVRSFAGGEMSPEMFSRSDDQRFQAGAETLLNCIPRPTGTVSRRPGSRLIRETRDSTKVSHLLPFVFSQTQSAVIEAGRATIGGLDSGYFRFHSDGGSLLFPMPAHSFKPAVTTNGANNTFEPKLTASCSVASPMVVTIASHGFLQGDQVWFYGDPRTLPDYGVVNATKPVANTGYYVRDITPNTFTLSLSATDSSRLTCIQHGGFSPTVSNYNRWRSATLPRMGFQVSEHRVQHLEPIAMTMWPDTLSPEAKFFQVGLTGEYVFFPQKVAGGYVDFLPKKAVCNQQVIFVAAQFGGTLPPNLTEGRLYWVTGWDASAGGWRISETKNGPALNPGGTGSGSIRLCLGPEADLFGGAADGSGFKLAHRYYAVVDPNAPNILNVETSIGNAQTVGSGFRFDADAPGCGPFKIHRAYQVGDLVTFYETAGGIRSFYAMRDWIADAAGVLSKNIHDGAGPRVPGSSARTTAQQGAYWRELPGRATGAPYSFTAADFVSTGTDQTFNAIGANHGLTTGQQVAIVDLVAPNGFTLDQVYWAIVDSAAVIRLATSYANALAGTAIKQADTPPQHGSLLIQAFVEFITDTVRWPAHGLSNGDTVVFGSATLASTTMQTGLTAGTVYYVREATTDTFRVSASAVGALLSFAADGVRVTAIGDSVYEVPHDYSAAELPRLVTTQSGDVMTIASQDHPVGELRRLSSTKWELRDVLFVAAVDPPGACFAVTVELGEGVQITQTATDGFGTRLKFVTVTDHLLQQGTPVRVTGLPEIGAGSLADGFYVTTFPTGEPGFEKAMYLRTVESGETVAHGGDTTGLDGRVRYGNQGEDIAQTYVVTAIDANNEESKANDPFEVEVNLSVPGATATIGWGASEGATRYRVYKEINGLFGFIGETDDLEFTDDNIGPDISVSPPILDRALRKTATVTFDATADTVAWADHGLVARTPVVFQTSDRMPGVEEGKTYYVLNPGEDEFQIVSDPDGEVALDITGTDTGAHTAVAGDFPGAATYFEGRRVFGGSRSKPQDIWMTASGTEADLSYSIPTVDTDRIYFRVASREFSAIRHLIPLSQLVLLSDSAEYRLTPLNDDVVTPSSISVRPQSFVGCGYPQPSLVNNTVVFAAARGGHMRELGYSSEVLGYLTGDLSLRAGHLFDGQTVDDQAYAKAPLPIVWCISSSGKLLGLTYIPEEGIGAWHQHTTDGTYESVTVVPEGDVDAVYVVVRRVLDGNTYRFVERFADIESGTVDLDDAFFVDCGVTYEGAATATIAGLDHLEGEAVAYLADGLAGTGTVTSGALALDAAASTVHVGLPFTTDIKTLPLSMLRLDAFGAGKTKNINRVWVRLFQSGAFEVGPDASNLRPSLEPAEGDVDNGLVEVTLPGAWTDDGQILLRQSEPLPLTVSGIAIEVASGD